MFSPFQRPDHPVGHHNRGHDMAAFGVPHDHHGDFAPMHAHGGGAAFGHGHPGFPPSPGFPEGPFRDFRGGFERGFGHGGHGRGGRRRKGNVRAAVLALLTERPMHGYEMIQEITERSGGFWRPSPGSVYPTLQLLADEGLVESDESSGGGRKLFALTEQGRAEADKSQDPPPWEQVADQVDPNEAGLRTAAGQLTAAVMQVSIAASSAQKQRAATALDEARHQLYLILAEAGAPADADDESDTD